MVLLMWRCWRNLSGHSAPLAHVAGVVRQGAGDALDLGGMALSVVGDCGRDVVLDEVLPHTRTPVAPAAGIERGPHPHTQLPILERVGRLGTTEP